MKIWNIQKACEGWAEYLAMIDEDMKRMYRKELRSGSYET